MNDFTKEELNEILISLDIQRLQSGIYVYTDLMDKIQRMIETYDELEYCAHSGIKLEKKNG